jgi:hypothetical protein
MELLVIDDAENAFLPPPELSCVLFEQGLIARNNTADALLHLPLLLPLL